MLGAPIHKIDGIGWAIGADGAAAGDSAARRKSECGGGRRDFICHEL